MNQHQTPSAHTFTQAQAQSLFDACNCVTEHRDCLCEPSLPTCSVCLCQKAIDQVIETSCESEPVTRDQFMAFFRSDDFHEKMSDDDCRELFSFSLKGASDFTVEFLDDIFSDYSVDNLVVVDIEKRNSQ